MKKEILTVAFLLISCIGANAQYFNPDKLFHKEGFDSQEEFSKWTIESNPELEEGTTLWKIGNPGWMTFSGIDETSTQSLSFSISEGQKYETSITSSTITNNKNDLVVGFYSNGIGNLYATDHIYGYFEISKDNGTTWDILFDSERDGGYNGIGILKNGWYYYYFNLPSEYNAKDFKLRFRVNAKEYSGYIHSFYIDGVFASQKYDVDAALTSLEPVDAANTGFTKTEDIKIKIENVGATPISSCDVSYQIDTESPVIETIDKVIAIGETLDYTFKSKANLGEFNKNYTITAKIILPDDGDLSNNEKTSNITNVTTGIPYTPVFHEVTIYPSGVFARFLKDEWETDNNDDDANWSQEGDIKNGATPYWYIQPVNAKEAVCSAILRSRPIYMEKDKYYDFNFNVWSVAQNDRWNKMTIYVTKDRLGKEDLTKIWSNESIDERNGLNNTTRFKVAQEGNYYLAFHCTSDKGADELRMDGIYLIDAPEKDAKLVSIVTPESQKFMYTNSETVNVILCNNGTSKAIEAGTLKINMSLNGGKTITESVPVAIGISENAEYSFNTKMDMSEKSAIDALKVWVSLADDENAKNDTLTQTLVSNVISTPYTANFVGSLNGEPQEMAFWEAVDNNKDGVTFAPKKSQWSSDYTFDYKPDYAETTDEILYSRPIHLKKDKRYKIQYRTIVDGENNEMKLKTVLYKVSSNGNNKQEVKVLYDEIVTGTKSLRQVAAIEEDAVYCIGFHITSEKAVDYKFSFSYLSTVEVVDYDISLDKIVMPGTYISAYNHLPIGVYVTNLGTETVNSITVKVSSPSMEQPVTENIQKTITSESSVMIYLKDEITFAGTEDEVLTFEVSILNEDAVPDNNTQAVDIHYLSNAKAPYNVKFKETEGFLAIDKNRDTNMFKYSSTAGSGSGMLSDQYNFYASNAKEEDTDVLMSRSIEMSNGKTYKVSFQYCLNTSIEGEIAPKLKVYAMNLSDASVSNIASLVNSGEYSRVYSYSGYFTAPADGIYSICFSTLKGYIDLNVQGTFSITEVTEKPDLEIVEIVTPADAAVFGDSEDVTVKIKTNTPSLIISGIPFSCKIGDKVYYASFNEALNPINIEKTVTFKNVDLNVPGDYELVVKADMQTDATPENNTLTKVIKSLPIIEMEVASIDNLISGKLAQETITATVRNNGKGNVNNIPVSYTISHEGAADIVVNEVIESTVEEDASIQYSFTQKADLSEEGTYTIKVRVNMPEDTNTDNDMKELNVVSTPKSMDAGVVEITNPTAGLLSKEQTITVKVKNFGEVDLYNTPISATVTKGDVLIKELSATLTEAKVGETSEVTFEETTDMYMYGDYTITAKTNLESDDNTENDLCTATVKAYKMDCGISEIIAPAGTTVEVGQQEITVVIENFGDVTIENIPVKYKLGTTPMNGKYTGSIAPKEKVNYTFSTTYRFQEKDYTLTAYTELEGDMDADNDALSKELKGVPVGIENTSAVTLTVYPNPVKNMINIESDKTMRSISIYDSKGQMVNIESDLRAVSYNANVSHLSDGIYFLLIDTEEGHVVRKFIKEK